MKGTITYQKTILEKRAKLVHAITHNVQYLAEIHRKNNDELTNTKDYLEFVIKEKDKLEVVNEEQVKKIDILEKD